MKTKTREYRFRKNEMEQILQEAVRELKARGKEAIYADIEWLAKSTTTLMNEGIAIELENEPLSRIVLLTTQSYLICTLADPVKALDFFVKGIFEDEDLEQGVHVLKESMKYIKKANIRAMSITAIEDMFLLAICMTTDEDEKVEPLDSQYGAFAYVHNFTVDYFSELGYVFFEKTFMGYKRIG
jgi:hypothetical protein